MRIKCPSSRPPFSTAAAGSGNCNEVVRLGKRVELTTSLRQPCSQLLYTRHNCTPGPKLDAQITMQTRQPSRNRFKRVQGRDQASAAGRSPKPSSAPVWRSLRSCAIGRTCHSCCYPASTRCRCTRKLCSGLTASVQAHRRLECCRQHLQLVEASTCCSFAGTNVSIHGSDV